MLSDVNADSLVVHKNACVDQSVAGAAVESVYQFERNGYFCVDKDSSKDKLVFNLTVGLKGGGGDALLRLAAGSRGAARDPPTGR